MIHINQTNENFLYVLLDLKFDTFRQTERYMIAQFAQKLILTVKTNIIQYFIKDRNIRINRGLAKTSANIGGEDFCNGFKSIKKKETVE